MRGPFGQNTPIGGYEISEWVQQHPPGRYRVIAPFRDADGREYAVGEEWELIAAVSVPHDDETLLVVSVDDKPFRYAIPLRGDIPVQLAIFESFGDYAARV